MSINACHSYNYAAKDLKRAFMNISFSTYNKSVVRIVPMDKEQNFLSR